MFDIEPEGPRVQILQVGTRRSSAGGVLSVAMAEGAPGPTFRCQINYTATYLMWQKITGRIMLPSGVSVQSTPIGHGLSALSLVWNRTVQRSDAASYRCRSRSVNDQGSSSATLELSVPGSTLMP